MKKSFSRTQGTVCTPRGFRAAGLAAGIKASGQKDLALIVSELPAVAAATFTTNQVKAAPVRLDLAHIKSGRACAIVANSGNANACTGPVGLIHARAMAAGVARRIGCPDDQVLVCSTGRIGVRLPIVKVESGIKKLVKHLARDGGHAAARAILTSDTFPKEIAVSLKCGRHTVRLAGMAKGAGMIHPQMATMLCFLTTDAAIPRAPLQRALRRAVDQSFNRISVDGDTSTNDTVILLANGLAGRVPLARFQEALNFVCLELAKMIVRDGEGVSRFVTVSVRGATNDRDAALAARAVANSLLVKTSWCGGDANWGRIMDALGYSRARVHEELVDISYSGVPAVRGGLQAKTPPARLKQVVRQPSFTVEVNLHLGSGQCAIHTTDLTEKYVEFNKGE